MTLSVTTEPLHLRLRDPFRIARHEEAHVVTTMLTHLEVDGVRGVGEAVPVAYYGETRRDGRRPSLPRLLGALDGLGPMPAERAADAGLAGAVQRSSWPHRSAATAPPRRAWTSRSTTSPAGPSGMPVWRAPRHVRDQLPPTDFSLGIDEPAVVAERARRATRFPALKIKVGGPADIETLEAVRGVYGGPLRVDANTGWQPEQAAALIPELARLGVELIEQPFPARAAAAAALAPGAQQPAHPGRRERRLRDGPGDARRASSTASSSSSPSAAASGRRCA